MKRIFLFLILLVAVAVLTGTLVKDSINDLFVEEEQTSPIQEVNDVTYYSDKVDGLYIAIFNKPIKLSYDTNISNSLKQVAQNNNFTLAINGSYFLENNSHAGLLIIDGDHLAPIALNDKQVTHIVSLRSGLIEIVENKDFDLENVDEFTTAFQTGPLMIKENEIQNEFINNSLNGDGRYIRTLLGVTSSGEKFFITTTKTYSLTELSTKLLTLEVFQNKTITVVNLDGGSSSAMYSKDLEEFNITSSKKLPIILGVN
jgi:exopolysaccharide biosynthesis protein